MENLCYDDILPCDRSTLQSKTLQVLIYWAED